MPASEQFFSLHRFLGAETARSSENIQKIRGLELITNNNLQCQIEQAFSLLGSIPSSSEMNTDYLVTLWLGGQITSKY